MEGKQAFKQERLNICKACSQVEYTFGAGMTCGKFLRPVKGVSCGCKLTWKASLPAQRCPQDKWGPVEKESKEDGKEG
jgi:hypothetical protein